MRLQNLEINPPFVMNLVLIGYMGSGKTVLGKALATTLEYPFIDLDNYIEQSESSTISDLFDSRGEIYFRKKESEAVSKVLKDTTKMVLATGGGVVKRQINRERLRSRGTVIHLHCPLQQLLERTAKDKKRPLLAGDDREEVLKNLMCERAPLYKEIEDYRFVSGERGAKQLAHRIVKQLREDGLVD